jgi:hypothetical protein
LDSVLQLVRDKAAFAAPLAEWKASVGAMAQAQIRTFDQSMRLSAAAFGLKPVDLKPTENEKKAARIVPRPLPKIKEGGYQGYQAAIQEAMKAAQGGAAPDRASRMSSSEIQLLCDGRNSALDIKKMLDTQFKQETPLEAVLSYLEVLKRAGLIMY